MLHAGQIGAGCLTRARAIDEPCAVRCHVRGPHQVLTAPPDGVDGLAIALVDDKSNAVLESLFRDRDVMDVLGKPKPPEDISDDPIGNQECSGRRN